MKAIKPNVKRNKEIVDMYFDYTTQIAIAKKFNISKARVNELLKKILGPEKMAEVKKKKMELNARARKVLYGAHRKV